MNRIGIKKKCTYKKHTGILVNYRPEYAVVQSCKKL